MISKHVVELLPAYALGILDSDENNLVESHLSICKSCRAELALYAGVVDSLPLGMVEAQPPPELKNLLMTRIQNNQPNNLRSRQPSWWKKSYLVLQHSAPIWGMLSLIAVLILLISNFVFWQRLNELEASSQKTMTTIELDGTEFSPDSTGLLVISMDGSHGVVVVDDLPVLDDSQQYQLWLIKDGQRTSGGVFSVDESGYGIKYISSPEPLNSYPSFGITIEPTGGSPNPTGEKVLGGEL